MTASCMRIAVRKWSRSPPACLLVGLSFHCRWSSAPQRKPLSLKRPSVRRMPSCSERSRPAISMGGRVPAVDGHRLHARRGKCALPSEQGEAIADSVVADLLGRHD